MPVIPPIKYNQCYPFGICYSSCIVYKIKIYIEAYSGCYLNFHFLIYHEHLPCQKKKKTHMILHCHFEGSLSMSLHGHIVWLFPLVLGTLHQVFMVKVKFLPNRLMVFLEEVPGCRIAESKILMILTKPIFFWITCNQIFLYW